MDSIVNRGSWVVGRAVVGRAVAAAAMLMATACGGGGSSTPTTPTPSPSPSPGGGSGTTITISSSGVSPATLTVSPGTRVTFVNNSGGSRQMNSDPHPEHSDCQGLNDVGFLTNGQSRDSGNLNAVRTCGYHDHNDPDNSRWKGLIVVR